MERRYSQLPVPVHQSQMSRSPARCEDTHRRGAPPPSGSSLEGGRVKKTSAIRKSIIPISIVILLSLLRAPCAKAQDSAKAAAAPPIDVSGFVDVYYSKNLAAPSTRLNKFRNFDINENQFTLSLAEIVFQKKAQPVGFRVDVDFGSTNDLVQSGNTGTLANIQQVYATAVVPVGNGLTVDVGKFVTFMGYEVIESKDNWNYSRSLLFSWAIPYFHVGARATYPVTPSLSLMVHVVNGWNNDIDNNGSKSVGGTISYALLPTTSVIFNWMGGREQPAGPTDVGFKNVFDLTLTHQLTDDLALALNADYGQEKIVAGIQHWKGVAVYGRYALDASSAVALRAEVFSDPNGYALGTGTPQDLKEVTATYEYKFTNALLVRGELRNDFSNIKTFDNSSNSNVDSNQLTFLVGLIAIF